MIFQFYRHGVAQGILALLFVVLVTTAVSAETTVRVGIYDNDPLSRMQGATGADGLMVDILKYVAREERWRLHFVPVNLKNGWQYLNSNQIDILVAAPYSGKTSQYQDFTETAVISTWAQIYYSADHSVIQSLLDLKNLTIGLVKDDPYEQELRDVMKRLSIPCRFVEFNNYGELFKAIQNKWVDAGAADRFYGILHGKEYAVVDSPIIFSPVEFRYAVSKNLNASILQTLNYHVGALKKNPDSIYYQLVDKLAGTSRDSSLYKVLTWGIALTVGFLCVLGLMIIVLRSQIRKKTSQLIVKNDELVRENARRCQAEEALRESEELYRTLAERSFASVYVIQDGRFCFVNSNTVKTFGYSQEEIIGQRSLYFVHEDDREQVKTCSRNMISGQGSSPYEYRLLTHAGTICWMLETVTSIQYAGRPAVLGTAMDISERKSADEERRALEAQLRQAQKMEAIGTLAGGIAHDFNNILGAVIGYAEMAQDEIPAGNGSLECVEQILKASERAKNLVKQILTFSRTSEQVIQPVNIKPVVKEVLKLLRASLPTTIDIRLELDAARDMILADPTQIHQVLMNLCTNAAHAMEGKGGMLTIGLTNGNGIMGVPSAALQKQPLLTGPHLEMKVSDTGHGIPQIILDRIFDPFFTTKEVGKGTGMGLSVVHGIIKSHGGMIHVNSEVGKGSSFQIFLPLAKDECLVMPELKDIKTLPCGYERILLVDDEEVLVEMGRNMLVRLGYQVTTTISSRHALELFNRQPDQFDLVITDLTMPQMTGLELSRKLAEIKPDISVVLCTGYSEGITPELLRAANIKRCLMKPFGYSQVAMLVRQTLDEKKDAAMVA